VPHYLLVAGVIFRAPGAAIRCTMAAVNPSAANPSRSWTRLDGVDLLRAVAIFFVLMNHVNVRLFIAKVPYTEFIPRALADFLVRNGDDAVQIFFAVSGFLITSIAIRRWGALARVNVRDFYVLRFARIAPLLLSLLAVLSILHAARVAAFMVSADRGGYWRALFSALTFHLNLSEAHWGYLPGNWDVLWSLSVEEMFYLFFPLACVLCARGRAMPLLALLCVLVVLGPLARTVFSHGNPLWINRSYLGGMDAIAMGCLTAILLAHRTLSRPAARVLGAIGFALLGLMLGFSRWTWQVGIARHGLEMTIDGVGTCFVIAWALQTQWRAPRIIEPFLLLGRRSYEIYLTHMFIVFALLHIFMAAGKPMAGVPLYFAGTILLSAIMGEIVARFYSEPMNRRLRRRFGDGADRLGSVIDARKGTLTVDATSV
jgi:peptidoglycan/LPS O-acetylase OafA/YrhL